MRWILLIFLAIGCSKEPESVPDPAWERYKARMDSIKAKYHPEEVG